MIDNSGLVTALQNIITRLQDQLTQDELEVLSEIKTRLEVSKSDEFSIETFCQLAEFLLMLYEICKLS